MTTTRIKKLFFLTKLSLHFIGVKNFYIVNTSDESLDVINNVKNEFFKHHLYFFRLRNSYFTIVKSPSTRKHFDRLKGTNYVVLDFFNRPFTHSFVHRILEKNKNSMFLYGAKCAGLFCDTKRFHKLVYLEKMAHQGSQVIQNLHSFKVNYANFTIKPIFINLCTLVKLRHKQLCLK